VIQAKKQNRKRCENTLARSNPKTSSTSRSKTASAATKSAPNRTRSGAASSTPLDTASAPPFHRPCSVSAQSMSITLTGTGPAEEKMPARLPPMM